MSMSAPWTRPGVTIIPKGHRPRSTDIWGQVVDLPEERLVDKIMQLSFNPRLREAASTSSLASLEATRRWRHGEARGYPCYPAKSPLRPAQLSRQQSWRAGPAVGVLKVTLQSARGLIAADIEGTSDPYVVVECGGQKKKSATIEKTLDPDWDEELSMNGILDDFIASGVLLRLFDWDELGSPDSLGEVKVPLTELRSKTHIDFVEKLSKGGRIIFSVTWTLSNVTSKPSLASQPSLASMPSAASLSTIDRGAASPTGGRESPSQEPLPLLPVILPHKFDWVFLAYQRNPLALGCSAKALDNASAQGRESAEEAIARGRALAMGREKPVRPMTAKSKPKSPPKLATAAGSSLSTPTLRRPPSANIFVPRPFESFR